MVKKITASGCKVLLLQKSILRDAVSDIGEHYLAKANILLVKDIERHDIEFISKTLGSVPIAHVDHLTWVELPYAELVEEVQVGSGKVVKITGIERQGPTISLLLRGSNHLVLDEADRSFHDALCVVRSLVQKNFIVPG